MRANCDTLSSLRLISWGNVCSLISKSIVSQALIQKGRYQVQRVLLDKQQCNLLLCIVGLLLLWSDREQADFIGRAKRAYYRIVEEPGTNTQ